MIKTVLDAFIPGDNKLGMPPASAVDFNVYDFRMFNQAKNYMDAIQKYQWRILGGFWPPGLLDTIFKYVEIDF